MLSMANNIKMMEIRIKTMIIKDSKTNTTTKIIIMVIIAITIIKKIKNRISLEIRIIIMKIMIIKKILKFIIIIISMTKLTSILFFY